VRVEQVVRLVSNDGFTFAEPPGDTDLGVFDCVLQFRSQELAEVVLDRRGVGLDDVVFFLVFLARLEDNDKGVWFVDPVSVDLVEVGLLLRWNRFFQIVPIRDGRGAKRRPEEGVLIEALIHLDRPLVDNVVESGRDVTRPREHGVRAVGVETEVVARVERHDLPVGVRRRVSVSVVVVLMLVVVPRPQILYYRCVAGLCRGDRLVEARGSRLARGEQRRQLRGAERVQTPS
jgi:hypothetical protein